MTETHISIVIPCRNEERHIRACLGDVLEFELPDGVDYEVLVVDGESTDQTSRIVEEIVRSDFRVKLLSNPERIAPTAMNRGIKEARGEWIMRLDAHARYPREYLRKCYETALRTGADNVGGVRETHKGGSVWTLAMSVLISHPFAAGNAFYRTGATMLREVDTVFCGFYRLEVFERIGLFNEKLVRAQDREFNARLRASGGRIVLNPDIVCTYYPRTRLLPYLRWTFLGGLWVYKAQRLSGTRLLSWRNYIPAAFVTAQLVTVWTYSLAPSIFPLGILGLAAYLVAALVSSVQSARQHRQPGLLLLLPPLFYLTHMIYGVGFLRATLESSFTRRTALLSPPRWTRTHES